MHTKKPFSVLAWSLLVIAILLIVVRLMAPSLIVKVINQQLSQTPGIGGSIDDVDLALFRGAYQIKGMQLYLQESVKDTPTVQLETVDLSILWSALVRGKVVAEVVVKNGQIQFVDEQEKKNDLTDEAKDPDTWISFINLASPISIDKVTVDNLEIGLTTVLGGKKQKNVINQLQGEVTNITNSRDFSGSRVARFSFEGLVMGEAQASISGALNPETKQPTFDINFEMQRLPIQLVDGLVDFYAPLDVEKGEIDAAFELVAVDGNVNGYVKAGIFDADVFVWKEDIEKDDDGIFTGIFEGLVDGLASIFESGSNNLLAVNVPVSGTIDNAEVSTFAAIQSLLYNAFVNAYEIKVDDSIELSDDGKLNKTPPKTKKGG